MKKHEQTMHRFKTVAERLHGEHGINALAAMLSMVYGAHHTPRSVLSSRSGYTAINLRNASGFMSRRFINDKLGRMLGSEVETGEFQQYPGGAVIDVTLDTADRIRALLESERGQRFANEIEICASLPDALLSLLPQGEYNDGRGYGGGRSGGYGGRRDDRRGDYGRSSGGYGNRSGGGGGSGYGSRDRYEDRGSDRRGGSDRGDRRF
jgi:hypothetical protein